MKKLYSLILLTVMAFSTYAATVTVVSVGNTFSPSTINVSVGDSIQFNITNAHDVVEVSMATYNANGNTSNGGFTLPFGGGNLNGLAAGTYYYVCTPHAAGGMKGTITVTAAPPSGCDLLITGAFDGPLSGGIPKLLELKVLNNIADLSVYGVSSVTNGQGTTGAAEFTFPAVAAAAGDFIYIATDSTSVFTYFGFYPNYVNNFMSVNGDDALELFLNGAVVDVFGEVDCDPNTGAGITNCPQWEYLDGWAYRNNGASCASTFDYTDWTFSGANATDGETLNSTATAVFPVGTYQLIATPKINISTPSFTMNEGAGTTIITNLLINPSLGTASSIQIHLVGGNGSAADLDLSAFGGGPFPLTIPIAANSTTLTVPITPIDDAIYEGTETFNFVLRNPTGGLSLGNDTTFLLTMTDNELPPDTIVNVNPTTVTTNEGAGTVALSFEIGQLSVNATTFSVDLQLNSGDAADINAYTTQTIFFTPSGSTTRTVTITLTDDVLIEGNDTLIFELVNPSAGLTLGTKVLDTLIILDNDLATATLATVTAVNTSGTPLELGNSFVLYGVVNSPDRGFNSTEFSFQDATGGITAYQSGTALTYNAVVGDSIKVTGKIGERFSVTAITDITEILVLSSGSTVAPAAAVKPDEANESTLIRVNGLQMVSASQWTPNTGASGFDVQVFTAVNDTFIVRIDRDYLDLYTTTDIPCGVFDVIGVGGQYDITSPYTNNYQLIPRFLTDVVDTCSSVNPANTIAALTEVDPVTGDPLLLGITVTVKGIITSPDFRELQATGTEFTFSDGTGGIWAYSTDSTISFNPVVGDSVQVTGNIGAASGVTRLYIDAVTSLGAATPFTPTVVSAALGEPQEAELIKINGLKLNGIWNSSGGSYNISATANGITYDIRVDADRIELFSVPLTPSLTFNMTGVGSQFDATAPRTEGYSIMPRFDSDIEIVNSINDLELANFSVSPIPASDILNFSFDYNANEIVTVAVIDILGKEVASKQVSLVKGMNVNSISVETLNTGFYVFQIKTTNGTKNTNILVK
jgi:plastocyanin